jgi:hypothetical protein
MIEEAVRTTPQLVGISAAAGSPGTGPGSMTRSGPCGCSVAPGTTARSTDPVSTGGVDWEGQISLDGVVAAMCMRRMARLTFDVV